MNVSIDALLDDNRRRLEYFLNDKGMSRDSHPVNPIRVQALNIFANAQSKEELDNGMDELICILLKVGDSELDEYTAKFIATAGLIVANSDDEISKEEVDQIISSLASLKIFPRKYLEEIAEANVTEIFGEAVNNLMRINPGMRDGMLQYMITIVLSDKIIAKNEVELLYRFGNDIGFSRIEVANAIAQSIQRNYVPSLDAIC